jgi:hypothetical protein
LHEQLKEAPMCHHGRIRLSAEDRKDVKKLSGIMAPVYATAMLACSRSLLSPAVHDKANWLLQLRSPQAPAELPVCRL